MWPNSYYWNLDLFSDFTIYLSLYSYSQTYSSHIRIHLSDGNSNFLKFSIFSFVHLVAHLNDNILGQNGTIRGHLRSSGIARIPTIKVNIVKLQGRSEVQVKLNIHHSLSDCQIAISPPPPTQKTFCLKDQA